MFTIKLLSIASLPFSASKRLDLPSSINFTTVKQVRDNYATNLSHLFTITELYKMFEKLLYVELMLVIDSRAIDVESIQFHESVKVAVGLASKTLHQMNVRISLVNIVVEDRTFDYSGNRTKNDSIAELYATLLQFTHHVRSSFDAMSFDTAILLTLPENDKSERDGVNDTVHTTTTTVETTTAREWVLG